MASSPCHFEKKAFASLVPTLPPVGSHLHSLIRQAKTPVGRRDQNPLSVVEMGDSDTSYPQIHVKLFSRKEKDNAIRTVDLRIAGGFRGAEKRWDRPLHGGLARVPQRSPRVRRLCRRRSAGTTRNRSHDKNQGRKAGRAGRSIC